jgi:hypothetical protein
VSFYVAKQEPKLEADRRDRSATRPVGRCQPGDLPHPPATPGRTDADRNCISNIHPPEGLGYEAAARVVAGLVAGARRLGHSGVELKDTSRADELTAGPTPTLE